MTPLHMYPITYLPPFGAFVVNTSPGPTYTYRADTLPENLSLPHP